MRHPFKSGSVLLLRLHFKEVAVNRLRRQRGTKQSLIFRHSSSVCSPPPKPLSPPSLSRAVPRPARLPRASLRGRAEPCPAHLHPPNVPQVPRLWFHGSAGAAVTAPGCSLAGGAAALTRSGSGLMDVCVCAALDESAAERGGIAVVFREELSASSSNLRLNVSDVNYKMEIHI